MCGSFQKLWLKLPLCWCIFTVTWGLVILWARYVVKCWIQTSNSIFYFMCSIFVFWTWENGRTGFSSFPSALCVIVFVTCGFIDNDVLQYYIHFDGSQESILMTPDKFNFAHWVISVVIFHEATLLYLWVLSTYFICMSPVIHSWFSVTVHVFIYLFSFSWLMSKLIHSFLTTGDVFLL